MIWCNYAVTRQIEWQGGDYLCEQTQGQGYCGIWCNIELKLNSGWLDIVRVAEIDVILIWDVIGHFE